MSPVSVPPSPRRFRAALLAALPLAVLLAGCATPPPATDREAVEEFRQNNDPAEPLNRRLFAVHQAIDQNVLRPVAVGYRDVVPGPIRNGIRNLLGNLRTPVILINDMLQGQPQRAGDTLGRFVVNTTLGLGGIFDVAADHLGVPGHAEDFGQTLAVYGVGEGPYLFIPVLGPSNPRDLGGFGAGILADPLTWVGQGLTVNILTGVRAGATIVDTREGVIEAVDALNSSLDPYSSYRSAYRQRRQAEIENRLGGAAHPAETGTGTGTATGLPPRR